MKTRSTRSQMNRNRATLDKHHTSCTDCQKPMDKTQTGPKFCQYHQSSSHRPTTSTNPEKATRSLSSLSFDNSSNIPICLNKNDRTANPNNMIPTNQVDSLAVSVLDTSEDKPERNTEIIIIDSSNDEEEPINSCYADLQRKKHNLLLASEEDESKRGIRLLDYGEDKSESGTHLLVPCLTEEDENYYATRKELCQEEGSTENKYTPYTNCSKDHSHKLSDSDTEVITPSFSPIKKSSASATPSLSRAPKKPLRMIDPNNTKPPRAELDVAPHSTRNPQKKPSKSPSGQELQLSPPNTVFDIEHNMTQTSSSSVIPKIRIRLSPTGVPEKSSITANQKPSTATCPSKASSKPKLCIASAPAKTPFTPEQKTPVTPRVRLNHYPAESSSKKLPTANQGPSIAASPGKSLPKPKSQSAWNPLDIKKESSPVPSKRRASVIRPARTEPYTAAKPQRRSSNNMVKETLVSSQENDSSQQRRSTRINTCEEPSALKKESALSTVAREVITISSDEPSEPIVKPKKRASKRKASLLTESSEPIFISSRQSQNTDDGVVKPRTKIRKKTLPLEMAIKAGALSNASKRKASYLTDPAASSQADESRRKVIKRTPPTEPHASSSAVITAAANKRTLRKRASGSFSIEFNAGMPFIPEEVVSVPEKEIGVLEAETDEENSASEEGTDADDEKDDEEEENKEEPAVAAEDHEEDDDFVDYLQMIKEDPVVGSFRLNRDSLTVSRKSLGDGQVGAVFAGTYDDAPVACKMMDIGVNEESFYFQAFKEIAFALKLAHCRNVIPYYGWAYYEGKGNSKGKFYLAQRLIDNGDGRKYLIERGTFSPDEVLHAATCLFSALSDAHAADIGVVDLKLENYLIDDSGSGYLTDLGSCVEFYGCDSVNLLDEGVTWTKAVAAPEMVRTKEFSKASDVFMGTLMIAELMTGLLPDYDFKKNVLRRKASGAVNFSSEAIDPCYDFLFSLLAEGLDTKASNRPTADEMLVKLTKIKKECSPEA